MKSEEREFPLGATLDDGTYVITEHLFGEGLETVYTAANTNKPDERFLASVSWTQTVAPHQIYEELCYEIPGVLDLEYVGAFDSGEDEYAQCAMLERLPPGMCVRQLVPGAVGVTAAVRLSRDVGETLLAAAQSDQLLVGIRPETIWAEREHESIRVSGLTDRADTFWKTSKTASYVTTPTYQRIYRAPESLGGQRTDKSLTFSLAVMLAEWATGNYPFPNVWTFGDKAALLQGRHAPLDLPDEVLRLVSLALQADPDKRPSLSSFLESLAD